YSGQTDICVGTPIAGRNQQEIEGLIGFFINTLALRSTIDSEISFHNLLQQVRTTVLDAYEHQDVPFEKVVEVVETERDRSHSAIFQAWFVLQNAPESGELHLNEVKLSSEGSADITTKFDLSIGIEESAAGLQIGLTYAADLYRPETMVQLLAHYEQLLQAISYNTNTTVGHLPMMTAAEEDHLLLTLGTATVEYPRSQSIIQLFEQQTALTPDNIAIVFEDTSLTYKMLDEKATQLAVFLQQQGVQHEDRVVVSVKRSWELLVGIIGTLKAGAAFVPVDPAYPAERLQYILKDTGSKLCIGDEGLKQKLSESTAVLCIDLINDWPQINRATGAVQSYRRPSSLAYVIYTSGSTGRPKGVMIEDSALLNHVYGMIQQGNLSACRSFAIFSMLTSDLSHSILFSGLMVGGAIHILSDRVLESGQLVANYLQAHQVDCMKMVSSLWLAYADEAVLTPRKVLVFGGEPLSVHILRLLREAQYNGELYNHYGPTETAIGRCIYKIDLNKKYTNIPIGIPFSNTRLYVVNGSQVLNPVGVAGELYIGGEGIARGYLASPELTAEKFIPDPFSKDAAARVYRTGDIVRWTVDGYLEYIGRKDSQVKINGYRVEPGEVESVLQSCPAIRQGYVLAKKDQYGTLQLIAFVVADTAIDTEDVLQFLQTRLPQYMVPAFITQIQQAPLTPNGKINRQQLAAMDITTSVVLEYEPPRNHQEKVLVQLWQELLHVEAVGIHDNFFRLGGHSLLAIRLISAIRKTLKREVAIRDIFDHPTIASLASAIATRSLYVNMPAVTASPRPDRIPLSFAQERLWFIDRFQGSLQYHMSWVFTIRGILDTAVLEDCFREIIQRHEVLRTVIREYDGEGYQHLLDGFNWRMNCVDEAAILSGGHTIEEYTTAQVLTPFDLSNDAMIRVTLIRISDTEHRLITIIHHIAFDGWSIAILVNELTALYAGRIAGVAADLTPLPVQYADYASWQRAYFEGPVLESKIHYWQQKLQGALPLQLPTDFERPVEQSIQGGTAVKIIGKTLRNQLVALSEQEGVTLFMTLLTAFKILLYRYSGQQDICVGTPVAGRHQQELEGLLGFFINTLVLRSELNGNQSFNTLLHQVKETTLSAYENQDVPFEKIVETLHLTRDASRNPLFQVMLVLRNTPRAELPELGETTIVPDGKTQFTSQFDITFFVTESAEGLHFSVVYCSDLFRHDTILRMTDHFENLLTDLVQNREIPISELNLLTVREQHQLLNAWNDTEAAYPHDKTVIDLFEEQVNKTPDTVALAFGQQQLTYSELNRQANQLAHYLQQMGIEKGELVPICIERSVYMVIAMIGIGKAGAAYVPIDPDYPQQRINYMLEDIGARLIITSEFVTTTRTFDHLVRHIVQLDQDGDTIATCEYNNPPKNLQPDDLQYVIYTSGSTGQPKGVMVPYKGVVNRLYWMYQRYQFNSDVVLLQKTPYIFDVSVWEFFMPLCFGGRLVLCSKEVVHDPLLLITAVEEYGITHIHFVPGMLAVFLQTLDQHLAHRLRSLQHVFCSGEELRPEYVKQHYALLQCPLHNLYGPTEASIEVSSYDTTKNDTSIPIGKPISNVQLYVLDAAAQLLPIGVPGELYIGGVAVAHGYLHQPALTAERFIENPFVPGTRMYRTGDRARWLPDGNIAFLGRKDEQVKVHGYRIELGEIENSLLAYSDIKQAAVIVRETDPGEKQLVGYIVPGPHFSSEKVFAYLRSRLPAYMVPAFLIELAELPLTENGKVNKQLLPHEEMFVITQDNYVAPSNDIEARLTLIWEELLRKKQIGVFDNFFELGGHSLRAMRLAAAVYREFAVAINLKEFFLDPTIQGIARMITNGTSDGIGMPHAGQQMDIVVQEGVTYFGITATQVYWVNDEQDRAFKENDRLHGYVYPCYEIEEALDLAALYNAISYLIQRHESLRSTFHFIDGRYMMKVEEAADPMFLPEFRDYRQTDIRSDEAIDYISYEHHRFRFDKGPLFLVRIIQAADERYIISFGMHHVIYDPWSMEIFLRDLFTAYKAFAEDKQPDLPQLPIQFKEYLSFENQYVRKYYRQHKNYWQSLYPALPGKLHIPGRLSFDEKPMAERKGGSKKFWYTEETIEKLNQLARAHSVSLFVVLQATCKTYLARITGQYDIMIATYVFGRDYLGAEEQIGSYARTVLIRTVFDEKDSFTDGLHKVIRSNEDMRTFRACTLREHLEEIGFPFIQPGATCWQINMQFADTTGIYLSQTELGEISQVIKRGPPRRPGKFILPIDMQFQFHRSNEGLSLNIQYDTSLYDITTIEELAAGYFAYVHEVLNEKHLHLSKSEAHDQNIEREVR
ncbi:MULTISPECIES: non-ribosomal peptide synthetase, partial [Niastella]